MAFSAMSSCKAELDLDGVGDRDVFQCADVDALVRRTAGRDFKATVSGGGEAEAEDDVVRDFHGCFAEEEVNCFTEDMAGLFMPRRQFPRTCAWRLWGFGLIIGASSSCFSGGSTTCSSVSA